MSAPLQTPTAWRGLCRLPRACARSYASTTDADVNSARAYCLNLLRHYDSPSFTLQGFIPHSARDAYVAIRAFNIETSRIPDTVSHSTIGVMRMQFWRELISKSLSGNPPKEPVAVLLAHAASSLRDRTQNSSNLSKAWFHRIISTREQYLTNPPYPALADLEAYAEATHSTLLYLLLSSLPLHSVTADHLASHIGKASGITAILRGLPLLAFPAPALRHDKSAGLGGALAGERSRQGVVTLPLDIMAESGLREEDVLRHGAEAPGLKDAVFKVATRANDHLITAREMLKNIRATGDAGHEFEHAEEKEYEGLRGGPREEADRGFGVLLHAVPTSLWLQRLEKADFDVFDQGLRRMDWRLPWKAYWAYRRRAF